MRDDAARRRSNLEDWFLRLKVASRPRRAMGFTPIVRLHGEEVGRLVNALPALAEGVAGNGHPAHVLNDRHPKVSRRRR
jgi:hypothetical protein